MRKHFHTTLLQETIDRIEKLSEHHREKTAGKTLDQVVLSEFNRVFKN